MTAASDGRPIEPSNPIFTLPVAVSRPIAAIWFSVSPLFSPGMSKNKKVSDYEFTRFRFATVQRSPGRTIPDIRSFAVVSDRCFQGCTISDVRPLSAWRCGFRPLFSCRCCYAFRGIRPLSPFGPLPVNLGFGPVRLHSTPQSHLTLASLRRQQRSRGRTKRTVEKQ